jgi:hypothetical protein
MSTRERSLQDSIEWRRRRIHRRHRSVFRLAVNALVWAALAFAVVWLVYAGLLGLRA